MAEEKPKLFSVNEEMFTNIFEDNFDDLTYDGDMPCLVLFGAERCKVCKELHPTLEEIIPDYKDKMNTYFVDVDLNKDLMKRFRLKGIPTLLVFNNGEVSVRMSGMHTAEELVAAFDEALA